MNGLPLGPGHAATVLAAAIQAGELRATDLMAATLERIDAENPRFNALITRRPADELMAEAAAIDRGEARGPLAGVPIGIKDLTETAGVRTTWGSPLLAEHVPGADAPVVARVKAAGALIVGKTNTPEFGLGSHTFNPLFGATGNVFDPAWSAGGSSGGAAVALAAGLLPLADGTDMMGSLRNPAAWNQIFGLRPSYGLVPDAPAGELFLHPLGTPGPMARSLGDLALLLDCQAGPHPQRPFNRPRAGSFRGALEAAAHGSGPQREGASGLRIGWLADWGGHYPTEPGILAQCEAALADYARRGVEVARVEPAFDPEALMTSWCTLRSWCIANQLAGYYEDAQRCEQLKPEAQWEVEQGLGLSARAVHQASEVRSAWYRCLAELFRHYDALALPTAQCFPFPVEQAWPREIHGRSLDTYHRWMEVVVPASLAGIPALSVPVGFAAADGRAGAVPEPGAARPSASAVVAGEPPRPVGLQLLGPPGGDAALLGLAARCCGTGRLA